MGGRCSVVKRWGSEKKVRGGKYGGKRRGIFLCFERLVPIHFLFFFLIWIHMAITDSNNVLKPDRPKLELDTNYNP